MLNQLYKGRAVYYAQIMPTIPQFEVIECRLRTIADTYFVGIEKGTEHAMLFGNKRLGQDVFLEREQCLKMVSDAEYEYFKQFRTVTTINENFEIVQKDEDEF